MLHALWSWACWRDWPKANLLLLDEPTNHLDAEGVRWLVEFINTILAAKRLRPAPKRKQKHTKSNKFRYKIT